MPRAGPKQIQQYALEFKRAAVRLSEIPDLEVQVVAEALAIHPAMLSRWRREARQGILRGGRSGPLKTPPVREIRRLQELERAHALLKEEHHLLKEAIRFCSARRRTSSRSSTVSGRTSR
jgi:transposase